MFNPKAKRLKILSGNYPRTIQELDKIFNRKTNIYIDWANVLGWQGKLNWHIDLKRLKQLLDSFNNVYKSKFYYGTLEGNRDSILENFIRRSLLEKFTLETIEYLNRKLKELNEKGVKFIEDKKCNFDVEIGRDMLLDYERNNVENFILWSGDSDFAGPVKQLLDDGKKVVIFAIVRRVASELSETGAQIFEIKKIKEFICWSKELSKEAFKSQKDSRKSP